MNDVEQVLRAHLERKAAEAEPTPDLDRVVRSAQASRSSGSVTVLRRWRRDSWIKPTLAVAAAVLVVVGLVAVSLGSGDSTTTDTAVSPADGEGQGDPAPTSADGVRLAALASLPAGGFAVMEGEGISLHGPDGTVIGEGSYPSAYDPNTPGFLVQQDEGELVVSPMAQDEYRDRGMPPGQRCVELDRTSAGTVETCSVADDGTDEVLLGNELAYVQPGGTRRVLVTGGPGGANLPVGDATPPIIGHWRYAALSPDGAWLAAQWSGECETSTAFLIRLVDGAIFGTDPAPTLDDDSRTAYESVFLGWNEDGRALIHNPESSCGESAEHPSVRSVDPVTGSSDELVSLAGSSGSLVYPWSRDQ